MAPKKDKNSSRSRSYWLYLHSYVHLSVKRERALLYNTLNYELLEFPNTSSIYPLLRRLSSDRNLYVIKINAADMDPTIDGFIDQIKDLFFGDLVDASLSTKKPIQLKPILKLQHTFDYLIDKGVKTRSLVNDDIPDYLNAVTLYMNNKCPQSCQMCRDGYRQFLCCRKDQEPVEQISMDTLKTLIQQARNSNLYKFNIIGGDIFSYTFLEDAMRLLNGIPVLKEYVVHYLNIRDFPSFFELLREGDNKMAVLVHFPVSPEVLDRQMAVLEEQFVIKQVEVRFILQDETEKAQAGAIISRFHLRRYRFIPYYNRKNIDFFKDNVFLTGERILASKPEMNDILSRSVLNSLDFKKLTIFSDKSAYANVNHPSIGTLGKDHLMEIVFNALNHSRSWTAVRRHVTPCKACAFNALCPPISNYEYVLGKYNLCHIYRSVTPTYFK